MGDEGLRFFGRNSTSEPGRLTDGQGGGVKAGIETDRKLERALGRAHTFAYHKIGH